VPSNKPMTAYVKSWTELLNITDSVLEMDPAELILDFSMDGLEHLLMETRANIKYMKASVHWLLVTASVVPSSPILVTLMKGKLSNIYIYIYEIISHIQHLQIITAYTTLSPLSSWPTKPLLGFPCTSSKGRQHMHLSAGSVNKKLRSHLFHGCWEDAGQNPEPDPEIRGCKSCTW
jgi:hypothetical protein